MVRACQDTPEEVAPQVLAQGGQAASGRALRNAGAPVATGRGRLRPLPGCPSPGSERRERGARGSRIKANARSLLGSPMARAAPSRFSSCGRRWIKTCPGRRAHIWRRRRRSCIYNGKQEHSGRTRSVRENSLLRVCSCSYDTNEPLSALLRGARFVVIHRVGRAEPEAPGRGEGRCCWRLRAGAFVTAQAKLAAGAWVRAHNKSAIERF